MVGAALDEPLNQHDGAGLQPSTYAPEFMSPHGTDHTMWSNVDLGEFMMDNDLDFLGRMFNFSHPPEAGI